MAGVLNLETGYVFIHVPKCAGASITSVLRESGHSTLFGGIPELEGIVKQENRVSAEAVKLTLHARARDIRNFLGADVYESLASFAVVRNPWDRLRSRYSYFRGRPNHPLYKFAKGSLSDFVVWACENYPGTMHERLTDRSGNVIVKHILKYESMESEFAKLSQMLCLNIDKLPHINMSSNSHEKPLYLNSVIDMVRQTYEKDFSLFEYPVDPPEN